MFMVMNQKIMFYNFFRFQCAPLVSYRELKSPKMIKSWVESDESILSILFKKCEKFNIGHYNQCYRIDSYELNSDSFEMSCNSTHFTINSNLKLNELLKKKIQFFVN